MSNPSSNCYRRPQTQTGAAHHEVVLDETGETLADFSRSESNTPWPPTYIRGRVSGFPVAAIFAILPCHRTVSLYRRALV